MNITMRSKNRNNFLSQWIVSLFMLFFLCLPLQVNAAKDTGQIKLNFTMPKEEPYNDIAKIFKLSSIFQDIVAGLNSDLVLPNDINVTFQVGDGPYYDPSQKKIVMSYTFINFISDIYLKEYPKATDEEMVGFALRTNAFIFYHELGHALIDNFDLPVVSNEETAADDLAVVLALELHGDEGYDMAMDQADLHDMLDATQAEYKASALWDEHALDSQRFYNIICLVYGKYPDKVVKELKENNSKDLLDFIKQKGDRCKDEYNKQSTNWMRLLEPFIKK